LIHIYKGLFILKGFSGAENLADFLSGLAENVFGDAMNRLPIHQEKFPFTGRAGGQSEHAEKIPASANKKRVREGIVRKQMAVGLEMEQSCTSGKYVVRIQRKLGFAEV